MSLTRRMRAELTGVPVGNPRLRSVETAGVLRFGGAWTLREGTPGWVLETFVAAVLRRVHRACVDLTGVRPAVEALESGGLAPRARYRLRLEGGPALAKLGLVDVSGHPLTRPPATWLSGREHGQAYLRGALMAAGTLSTPGRPPHLELRAPTARGAEDLRTLLANLGVTHITLIEQRDSWRVVCKSGEQIGRMLTITGAHGCFLAFDEGRLRRQLRNEANRAANAERGNLGRAVAASARQVASIERLLREGVWESLDAAAQETALARLANPGASLSELAALLGSTRATVHRRLLRLEAESSAGTGVESPSGAPLSSTAPDHDPEREQR